MFTHFKPFNNNVLNANTLISKFLTPILLPRAVVKSKSNKARWPLACQILHGATQARGLLSAACPLITLLHYSVLLTLRLHPPLTVMASCLSSMSKRYILDNANLNIDRKQSRYRYLCTLRCECRAECGIGGVVSDDAESADRGGCAQRPWFLRPILTDTMNDARRAGSIPPPEVHFLPRIPAVVPPGRCHRASGSCAQLCLRIRYQDICFCGRTLLNVHFGIQKLSNQNATV